MNLLNLIVFLLKNTVFIQKFKNNNFFVVKLLNSINSFQFYSKNEKTYGKTKILANYP